MSEKITHEEAKNELATFRGIADYSYNHLWLYIKQQEKQQKLLELYKDFFASSCVIFSLIFIAPFQKL